MHQVINQPPFELEAIDHVLLLVSGMERALAFYEGVLGATVESRLPQYAMTELRAGISHIDLVDTSVREGGWAMPPVAGGRNVDHVALRIGTIDEGALRKYLEQHRVPVVEEREEDGVSGKTLSLYVRDPSGNTIELIGTLR